MNIQDILKDLLDENLYNHWKKTGKIDTILLIQMLKEIKEIKETLYSIDVNKF